MEYLPLIITGVLTGGVFGFVQFLIQRGDSKKEKETEYATKGDIAPLREGIMAILQERLESMMTKHIDEGEITPTQLKTIETLLKAYENLGGDGFIHTLYEQCKELL